jgi:peptide chain release factor subunit 1
VIRTVDVAYGGENGLNQAIELSQDSLTQVKFVREKNLVSKFFENIDMDSGTKSQLINISGLVVYGVDDTMKSITSGAVETIVCWEGLTHNRVVLKNRETGGTHIYINLNRNFGQVHSRGRDE